MSMKESALSKDLMNNRGSAYCIGNGQVNVATSMSYEISQTLNCMHDAMAILVVKDESNKSQSRRLSEQNYP